MEPTIQAVKMIDKEATPPVFLGVFLERTPGKNCKQKSQKKNWEYVRDCKTWGGQNPVPG